MNGLTPISMVRGEQISLVTTHPGHLGKADAAGEGLPKSFGQMLFDSIDEISLQQTEAENLQLLAVTNPDLVNPETVTIAMAKAELSLSLAKKVMDEMIQAYKDITNLR